MSDSLKDRVDLRFLSGFIFFLSVGAIIAVCITTTVWHDVYYIQRDTWSAAFFHFFAAVVAVVTLVLVIVPAALLYSRARRRLDLVSFCIGIIAILILGAEFYSLSLIHLKTGRLTNRCSQRGAAHSVPLTRFTPLVRRG